MGDYRHGSESGRKAKQAAEKAARKREHKMANHGQGWATVTRLNPGHHRAGGLVQQLHGLVARV